MKVRYLLTRPPPSSSVSVRDGGTSFQLELDAARVRLAKRLLVESDSSLTEIAYDVGCASPQHFSTLFRRVVGAPPSAWRAERVTDLQRGTSAGS